MNKDFLSVDTTIISTSFSYISICASLLVLLLLSVLHIVSPEFDPSWRMVSEYANGNYSWVLSLMFIFWAISTVALFVAIKSQLITKAGKIGLFFLLISSVGEAMASVFDIDHSLHALAAFLGIGLLPIAAVIISKNLSKSAEWFQSKRLLMTTAHLTWISVLLMAATFGLLIYTYTQAGGDLSAGVVNEIPAGVIAVVGWANRFLIVVYCIWIITIASKAVKLKKVV